MENVATASSVPPDSVARDDVVVEPRLRIAQDIADNRHGDQAGLKGTIDQLFKNPFFTAVGGELLP